METKDLAAEIIAIERAALEKWNNGNPDGYLELLSDDITYFDPSLDKRFDGYEKMQTYYEGARGQVHVDRYDMVDPKVQASGNMAVLTFNLYSYKGEEVYKWNCTEVYHKKEDGKWEIIHNHWSFIRPMDM